MSIEIKRCLKRDRDIGRKAVLSHIKTAFTCTPALIMLMWKIFDWKLKHEAKDKQSICTYYQTS